MSAPAVDTQQRIQSDLNTALKAGEKRRVETLRMLRAKLQEARLAADEPLDEEAVATVIGRYAKQVRESIDAFEKAGRNEQKKASLEELAVVEAYLPRQLTDEELHDIVKSVIAQSGATSPKEMGKVMGLVMAKVKGKAEGGKVSQLVREELGRQQ